MSVKIHFVNVGAGDCTIVDFPDREISSTKRKKSSRVMMIDINNCIETNNTTNIFEYYKKHFNTGSSIRPIFRFVCTHPHKDHITGIDYLFSKSNIGISNFWNIEHDFYPEDWKNDPSPEDWEMYKKIKEGRIVGLNVLNLDDNTTPGDFWSDDEDRITILSPSLELYNATHYKLDGSKRKGEEVDLNNMPFVLLLKVNNIKILFASDAEDICWKYILDKHKDKLKNIDILKAAHHGRLNGFSEEAIKLMSPKYIIFSNSEKHDCDHGAEKEYKKAVPNVKIYKTCTHGNILSNVSFDGVITFEFEKVTAKI
jgi:competence protein ComEC